MKMNAASARRFEMEAERIPFSVERDARGRNQLDDLGAQRSHQRALDRVPRAVRMRSDAGRSHTGARRSFSSSLS